MEKQSKRDERKYKVLLGLVEYFLKTAKPVGSNTLKEEGFPGLSSATLRNYFSSLEEEGYLKQQHSSGGRIPTEKAYRFYAEETMHSDIVSEEEELYLRKIKEDESKQIAKKLLFASHLLSDLTGYPVFLSAPRFDQDFVRSIHLVLIGDNRLVALLVTDFGLVQSEVMYVEGDINASSVKKLEAFCNAKLLNTSLEEEMSHIELSIAKKLYSEIMVRYLASYGNFSQEDVYSAGFSKLLNYPDLGDPTDFARALSLFESSSKLNALCNACMRSGKMQTWIGNELSHFIPDFTACSAVALPYHINQSIIGVVGVLGPLRMQYKEVFGLLKLFTRYLSESLTSGMYKFKLSYRRPDDPVLLNQYQDKMLIDHQEDVSRCRKKKKSL